MQIATDKLVARVADGNLEAIDTLIYCKKGQELFKQLEEKIKPLAISEMKLQKGETYTKFDSDIISKEVGTKYDFTVCEDPEWIGLKAAADKADKELKDREKFLKGLSKPLDTFNEGTGETFKIHPPLKTGSTGLAITLK